MVGSGEVGSSDRLPARKLESAREEVRKRKGNSLPFSFSVSAHTTSEWGTC